MYNISCVNTHIMNSALLQKKYNIKCFILCKTIFFYNMLVSSTPQSSAKPPL